MTDTSADQRQAAADLLDRCLALYDRAAKMLEQAIHNEDRSTRWVDDALLSQAVAVASIAGAGARIAHALYAAELVAADRRRDTILTADPEELEEILDRFRDQLEQGAASQRRLEEQSGAWDGPEPRDG